MGIDSLIDYLEALHGKCAGMVFPTVQGGAFGGTAEEWCAQYWDVIIPVIEKRLQAHSKTWVCGSDRPTIADFKVWQNIGNSLANPGAGGIPQDCKDAVE